VTYISATIDERQKMFKACQQCPLHLTGSRKIAKIIKGLMPKTVASTGGPNTLIATDYTDAVGQAVQWSNLIENKGK